MKKDYVSSYVIKRLPRYYRFLGDLIDEGRDRISSSELGGRLKLTASQVRQDLNCFGEFGQQGYGYNVELLREEIGRIIGINGDKSNTVIILGAGKLGSAICDNPSFEKRGCKIIGIFDKDPALKGKDAGGHKIRFAGELENFCRRYSPDIAVLCVPKESAKLVCEELIGLGVTNFWNFTHFDINLHFDDVNVENVHLGDGLLTLVYNLNAAKDDAQAQILGPSARKAEAERQAAELRVRRLKKQKGE
ncbi:MAG: redox-sensing transcriptional repressor Rex [Oscillospiraceae bacterium]|nr:redox-sensing transcriptional repressor Rex [Oscillospiraceae bacterium]